MIALGVIRPWPVIGNRYDRDHLVAGRHNGMTRRRRLHCHVTALLGAVLLMCTAQARQGDPPYSLGHGKNVMVGLPVEDVGPIDAPLMRAMIDARARAIGPHDKRLQVAVGSAVEINPSGNGVWTHLPDGSALWRVKVRARGATDLRLGFSRYDLPSGATLHVIGRGNYYQGPFTAADAIDGRFQAPLVPGDTATVEVHVPADSSLPSDALEVSTVGAGFRDRFAMAKADASDLGTSGACNVNVACPLGQAYPDEIRAVGQYELQADADGNYYECTGTLITDVPHDHRNYFVTAAHCIGSDSEAASVVVYWNYQSTLCDQLSAPPGGYFNDDQHGAVLRASRADVDFTLIELNQTPDPAWNLYYAGWDASGATPIGTIGIHHPSADVKKITAGPGPGITGSCISDTPTANNTHWATGPYTQGTTEDGSSGSGLFASNAGAHARLLIGTLSGGDAACSSVVPSQPNAGTDCYGRLAVAWNGATAASRLRDWLDPAQTGATSTAGIDSAPSLVGRGHSTHAIPAILLDSRTRPDSAAAQR